MINAMTRMGFAGLLAAVLIALLEQVLPGVDFDAAITGTVEIEGLQAGITLRWGIIGLFFMAGQWIKEREKDAKPEPPAADPAG